MDDNWGDLYEENHPVLLFGSKDESHAMHRPCRFAPNRHVLPQDACHKRFSAAYVSVLSQECDTLLCVGREKHFKLFFDLITSDPSLSRRINELGVPGKKRSQSFPVMPTESGKKTVQRSSYRCRTWPRGRFDARRAGSLC